MSTRQVLRTNFSRGEAIGGVTWLAIGAVFSLVLEVVYLGARVDLPGLGSVAVPWTILAALLFNGVLTKTARLWSDRTWVALVPLTVWGVGFLILLFLPDLTGDQLLGNNMRTFLLLIAGIVGGVWPLIRGK